MEFRIIRNPWHGIVHRENPMPPSLTGKQRRYAMPTWRIKIVRAELD
jgi:hypothetical protein